MPVSSDAAPSSTDSTNGPTHRQRRRASRPAGSAQREPKPTPPEPLAPDAAVASEKPPPDPKRRGNAPRRDNGERAWRELAGSGPSQVGVDGALRARDVNRPTEEELAQAEHDTVIVRRNWRPDDH
ncbi:MAG: hypothetical protein ACR2KJ_02095 [Jatrophihabitans sp.]